MLSITYVNESLMLNVIMLNAVMLGVLAPNVESQSLHFVLLSIPLRRLIMSILELHVLSSKTIWPTDTTAHSRWSEQPRSCHFTDSSQYLYTLRQSAKCQSAKCQLVKCQSAKCQSANCQLAKCQLAKCQLAKC
jgi:hypothetical protein